MKTILLHFLMVIFFVSNTERINSQVAVNNDNSEPDPSSMLDVKSSEKGFLPPRMSELEKLRIENPAEGLIIYNTTRKSLETFDGETWFSVSKTGVVADPLNYQVCIGGSGDEAAYSVMQTTDGGFLITGTTSSFGAGSYDLYVVKLAEDFTLDNSFGTGGTIVAGGTNTEYARGVVATADGGYLAAGYTYTFGAGGANMYCLKMNTAGVPDISFGSNGFRTIGGSLNDRSYGVVSCSDGNFIICGYNLKTLTPADYELYIVKIDGSGSLVTGFGTNGSVKIGGTSAESASKIIEVNDGGFVIAGYTSTFGAGGNDMYIVKLNSAGVPDPGFGVNGTFVFGGSADDAATDVIQTPDYGFVVVGSTQSFGAGGSDFYVVKLTSSGTLDNSFGTNGSLTFGGTGTEGANAVLCSDDGTLIIGGRTNSFGAGGNDMYVLKISSTGIPDNTFGMDGTLTIGGTGDEDLRAMCAINGGGYLLAGSTDSFGLGGDDMFLVRINIAGKTCGNSSNGGTISGSGGTVGNGGTVTSGATLGAGGALSSGGSLTEICK